MWIFRYQDWSCKQWEWWKGLSAIRFWQLSPVVPDKSASTPCGQHERQGQGQAVVNIYIYIIIYICIYIKETKLLAQKAWAAVLMMSWWVERILLFKQSISIHFGWSFKRLTKKMAEMPNVQSQSSWKLKKNLGFCKWIMKLQISDFSSEWNSKNLRYLRFWCLLSCSFGGEGVWKGGPQSHLNEGFTDFTSSLVWGPTDFYNIQNVWKN